MKRLLLNAIFLLLAVAVVSSCQKSVTDKTLKAFDEMVTHMNNIAVNRDMSIIDKEVIYTAPNDSLAILEFTAKIKGQGSTSMYFGYVVSKEGEDDDYWVLLFNNPVTAAEELQKGLSGIGSQNGGKHEVNEDLLYSTIRLGCSATYSSGQGKSMKETRDIIKSAK